MRVRVPQPWLRSASERYSRAENRPVSVTEVLIILVVAVAVVAAAVWFFTISFGGLGPGTV